MASKKVILTAKPQGIEVEADGFHGEGCQAVVDGIVHSMGPNAKPDEPDRKPDFYNTEVATEKDKA